MRFLVFSDVHVHNYKTFGGPNVNGMNRRADKCLGALFNLLTYAIDNKIKLLVFCGDWFVPRKEIDIFILNAVMAWINKVKACGIELIIVQGNHDKYSGDKDGIYVLQDLMELNHVGKYGSIFRSYKNAPIDFVSYRDCDFLICPYFETSDSLHKYLDRVTEDVLPIKRTNPIILLAHTPVFHAKTPSGYVFPFGFVLDEEVRKYFLAGFFGDNHKYQNLTDDGTDFYSVGSVLQHDFGDEGQPRGFLDVYIKEGDVELKLIDLNMPKFFTIDKEKAFNMNKDNFNYYRIVSDSILSDDEKEKLQSNFGNNFEIIFKYNDEFVEDDETRSAESLVKKDLFEKYMKESCSEGVFEYKGASLKEKRLTKMGLDLFAEQM